MTVDSARFGIGSFTDDDVVTRIEPPPRFCIEGTTARIMRSVLNSNRSIEFCHAASSNESVEPAGDLDIFADLGFGSMELAAVCSDLELYPDEMLAQVAARIGFGPAFDRVMADDLT